MPTEMSPGVIAVCALEATIVLVGLVLLWRFQWSTQAKEKLNGPRPLGRWNISLPMFMQTVLCVICGGVIFQLGLAQFIHRFVPSIATNPDLWTVVVGSSIHVGALLGLVVSHFLPDNFDPLPPEQSSVESVKKLPPNRIALAGGATLVTLMPVITLTAFAWQLLLNALHVPVERQELIDIFNKAESGWQIAGMIFFAVVIAPLTEELVFRAGLFRFLRTRVPRWLALCGPAALFAAVHGNIAVLLPLFVLGIVFSLAYERTGRILVTVIAHGLFNLNTIIVLLSGIKV